MEMDAKEQEAPQGEILDNVGMSEANEGLSNGPEFAGGQEPNDPLYVQKRLKQQKRAHEREIRGLHERINAMQSGGYNNMNQSQGHGYGDNAPSDDPIQRAVQAALQARDAQERQAREAEMQAKLADQYKGLHNHLDSMADKYDDFHDVVTDNHSAPFTPHMRDYALTLPKKGPGSAGEVFYKLGKNPEELHRISRLHPLEQGQELMRLSHALVGGAESKRAESPNTLGQIKSNPVLGSKGITDKTSVSDLRHRMKSGKWK